MGSINLGLNEIGNQDLAEDIQERIIEDIDLDEVEVDLSKFELKVDYNVSIDVKSITVVKKE